MKLSDKYNKTGSDLVHAYQDFKKDHVNYWRNSIINLINYININEIFYLSFLLINK